MAFPDLTPVLFIAATTNSTGDRTNAFCAAGVQKLSCMKIARSSAAMSRSGVDLNAVLMVSTTAVSGFG